MDNSLLELVKIVLPMVEAAALVLARPLGFIIVFPVFGWMGLQGMIRNTTALVIGFPLLASVYGQLTGYGEPLPTQYIAILAAKELLVGLVIGVVLGAPFWAAETAGSYIDVFRGSAMATVASPSNSSEPLITGAIFSLILVVIFMTMGGLRLSIEAIYDSYKLWAIFDPVPNVTEALAPIFLDLLSKVFRVALALGAPIMIAMFLGELALAFASRFAQQINVFDTTLSVKNLIYLFILPPYIYLLTTIYGAEILDIPGLMKIMERIVSP